MKPLVVATAPVSPWVDEGLEAEYEVLWLHKAKDRDAFFARASTAQVLVTNGGVGADAALIDALPALKLIAVHAVGYDAVDVDYAKDRGIAVTNTPDVLTQDVADFAIALMLAAPRRLIPNAEFVKQGRWLEGPAPLGRRVHGARFGILGMGRIGSAIATRLEGFGGSIAYHNRNPVEGSPYDYAASPLELAGNCDILFIALSGGAGTEGIVDGEVMEALGPSGMIINIGRGSCVDQAALIAALREGKLGWAALDVLADEPHVPEELLAMEQVVIQPHMASATMETRKAMGDLVLENVAAFLAGHDLVTPVR